MKAINEKYLQFVASFLVVLVLTIPFYVADAHATIESVSVKGSDNVEGYARQTDFLNFKVNVFIGNEKITPGQVILGANNKFQKCTPDVSDGFDCLLRFPNSGTDDFEPRTFPFTINLFNNESILDDSITSDFTVDNKAPEVALTATKSKYSSNENITIEYQITDFACNEPSCSNKCVGIKGIEFSALGNPFSQKVDISTSDCSSSGIISIESTKFEDGLNSIFAKATDNFKQVSSESSASFEIDTTTPLILADSFEIIRKGISISSFSPQKIPVAVSINISAEDFDAESATADLSSLNPSSDLKNAKASCSASGSSTYTCKWNIELKPNEEGSKSVVIQASDLIGNKASVTISRDLTLDSIGPKVLFLATAQVAADRVFAKLSGNKIVAELEESTGLAADDVFLHASGSKIPAKNCVKEGNWICTWENVNFNKNNPRMSIEKDTLDVLGNSVLEEVNVTVIIDDKPPVLKSLNITNIGGTAQAFPGLFKIGDKIAVFANLTEDNDLFASADFSKFVADASNVEGSCERIQADEQVCVWVSDPINLAGSGIVTFNFSDNTGNTLVVARSLKVLGLENATVPDFWTNEVRCSPKTIDRQLGPLINQREFCQVKLLPKSNTKTVKTIFISPATCTGDTSLIENIETSNTEAGSTSPLIKLTLKRDEFRINAANLTCSLDIFSQIDSKITQNPEIENVPIKILFSNLPLGELEQNVKDDIKQAKKDAEGIWELISVLNKIVFYAKKICQLINTFYNIVAVLYSIAIYFEILALYTKPIPLLGVAFEAPAIGTCTTETSFRVVAQNTYTGLNKFCAYANCKQTILWGPSVQNWINNQPLLSPSSLLGTETKIEGDKWYDKEVKLKNPPEGKLKNFIRPTSEYMDPNKNLLVATLFACLPGIIYGLDKYRQIKCLYADCLQNSVGKEGLPVTACEDQKAFATCKYITTELFAVFPWTAMFDYYMNLIKNAMSNPFIGLSAGISLACSYACSLPSGARSTALYSCEFVRYVNQLGAIVQDVKGIIDEGFKIRTDYCERLEDDKDEKKDKK